MREAADAMGAELAAGRMELHGIRTATEQRDAMRANIVSKRRQEILDLTIKLTKMSASEEDRQMALEHTAALEARGQSRCGDFRTSQQSDDCFPEWLP